MIGSFIGAALGFVLSLTIFLALGLSLVGGLSLQLDEYTYLALQGIFTGLSAALFGVYAPLRILSIQFRTNIVLVATLMSILVFVYVVSYDENGRIIVLMTFGCATYLVSSVLFNQWLDATD